MSVEHFFIKVLEVNTLNTAVNTICNLSKLIGHLSILGVRAHSVGDTSGDLSSGLHDHAESLLEVVPEIKVLQVLGMLSGKVLEVETLNTVVNTIGDLTKLVSHLTILRVGAHGVSDTSSDLSSRLHDHTETLLEVVPEVEVLQTRLGSKILEVGVLNSTVDSISNLTELVSHLTILRVGAHGVSNTSGDLSSRLHDHAESSLEVVPEVEVLQLRLSGKHLIVKTKIIY